MIIRFFPITFFLKLTGFRGLTFWPFIFLSDPPEKVSRFLLNHERIHIVQQMELWVVGFHLIYLFEYLKSRFKGKKHRDAYHAIRFEQEAHKFDVDLNYLKTRKPFAYRAFTV